jgi:hypothetical protein
MERFFLSVAFCISVLTLPWWVSTLLAIFLLAEGGSVILVILGGVCLDVLFGAPIASLYGFAYLYTALFASLALVALYLKTRLLE